MTRVMSEYGSDCYWYDGKTYECKWVYFKDGERLIAPVSLLNVLERDNFEGRAESIDNEIYAYADDDILYGNEADLVSHLDTFYD